MDCISIKELLLRLVDDDLPAAERDSIEGHIGSCTDCRREWQAVSLMRRAGLRLDTVEPPPFFYASVLARIRDESQGAAIWQITSILARHMVPALALITLVFVSVFAYFELSSPHADIYQAYDSVFTSTDRPSLMVLADPGEITEQIVLETLTEEEPPPDILTPPKND